jgi:hypothetical protein
MSIADKIVLIITLGIITLLFVIIVGDYIIAVDTGREISNDIITLMKMSVTGLIGIIGGYITGRKQSK